MTQNAKELWDRSKISTISMTTEAEQAFFSHRFTGPCNELHKDPICNLLWEVPLRIKSLGRTSPRGEAGACHYIW